MKILSKIILSAIFLSIIACGGAGSTGNTDVSEQSSESVDDTVQINIKSSPAVGRLLELEASFSDSQTELSWEMTSSPEGSEAVLTASENGLSASFTPDVRGEYMITLKTADELEEQITVTAFEALPFDESGIEGYDGTQSLNESAGVFSNQSWVYSKTLTPDELAVIIESYTSLSITAKDETLGLLVQYDDTDTTALEELEALRYEVGVDSVFQRTFIGSDVDISLDTLVNDFGEESFYDTTGPNWYLEGGAANIIAAWDIETGSEDILIGVADVGFVPQHEDVRGRFQAVLGMDGDREYSDGDLSHGTAVAGTIAAIPDNERGTAGINWASKIVAGTIYSDRNHSISDYHKYLDVLRYSTRGKSISLVNSSWKPGVESINDISVNSTIDRNLRFTRVYRAIVERYDRILHIWAAGNDSADATTRNGALHLNDAGDFSFLDNLIVVAAHVGDGRLAVYSNYGRSVDICAPAEFLAPANIVDGFSTYYTADRWPYGSNYSGGFNGTSSASPVVTGTASLIYSMNPDFTPGEVKRILIDSATDFCTERWAGNFTRQINHDIPRLNAGAALAMARDIINERIRIDHEIADRFAGTADISVSPLAENFHISSIDYVSYGRQTGEDEWHVIDVGHLNHENEFTIRLNSNYPLYKVSVEAQVRNNDTNNTASVSKDYNFFVRYYNMAPKENISLEALGGVRVQINKVGLQQVEEDSASDENPNSVGMFLEPGNYRLFGIKEGFVKGAMELNVPEYSQKQQEPEAELNLKMTPEEHAATASISGKVTDVSGSPVSGASVRISGGEQTNGFFASAQTDAFGRYSITNISKLDSDNVKIPSFEAIASKDGYELSLVTDIILLSGKDKKLNFTLTASEEEEQETVYFSDDFETDKGWTATYFWHRQELEAETIANTFYDSGVEVALPPDEETDVPYLPAAYSGSYAFWFGEEAVGSYENITSEFDYSTVDFSQVESPYADPDAEFDYNYQYSFYGGRLTSPAIDLSLAQSPVLSFMTWWEIESVNPNSTGYDIMAVEISTNGTDFVNISKLNPYIDPNEENRDAKPFTSGGFNRAPVWADEIIDLSDYAGETVYVRFVFNTADLSFNKFRGWIIDDFQITENSADAGRLKRLRK